jgi:N-methylhydantoinase B
MTPGSMPAGSRDLWQEGLVIPPVRLVRGGVIDDDLLALICANSRTPRLRRGDFRAQIAANQVAQRRLAEIAESKGLDTLLAAYDEVLAYAERRTRDAIRQLPDGTYRATGELEGDGVTDDDIPIEIAVTVAGDEITVDFTGTAPAVAGNVNCPLAVTRSACYFALRVLLPDDVPANAGTYGPMTIVAPEGSLVHATPPHAVVAGNVETSQRIADTVLAALGAAADVPAAGQGTMNNLVIGGTAGGGWSYYETIAGGQGGSSRGDGPSGVHVGMTNTLNTPVEALELEYPMRVERYELVDGTGGDGEHRGGDGVIRSIRMLSPATVTVLTDRRRHPPAGARGGRPGTVGRNLITRGSGEEQREEELGPKSTQRLDTDDIVTVITPGGGGWGQPAS